MPIQNMHTKEIMSVETYKKRRDLEELFGIFSGVLYEWTAEQIEMEWYKEFQSE